MYEVIWQEQGKIEILLTNQLTRDDFQQILHQLESLASMYSEVNVLLDGSGLEKFDFDVDMQDTELYKAYKDNLNKIAFVADGSFPEFMKEKFQPFENAEIEIYSNNQVKDARKWVFPSPLPG